MLAHTLGVKQMRVVVNKMDLTDPPYSESRFEEIKVKVSEILGKAGFAKVTVMPISGLHGENLTKRSDHFDWYDGPALLRSLDAVALPKRPIDKPLRIPLQDVFQVNDVGVVPVGRIEAGQLRCGMELIISPVHARCTVETIQQYGLSRKAAAAGDNVGFAVKGVDFEKIYRGCVVSEATGEPARAAKTFTAQVIIMDHPGEISVGYTPVIDIHTAHVACTVIEIKEKLDRRTGKKMEAHPISIKKNESCIMVLKPTRALCVENFKDCAPLGRFVMRDRRLTVAIGVVKTVEYEDEPDPGVPDEIETLPGDNGTTNQGAQPDENDSLSGDKSTAS